MEKAAPVSRSRFLMVRQFLRLQQGAEELFNPRDCVRQRQILENRRMMPPEEKFPSREGKDGLTWRNHFSLADLAANRGLRAAG
jgi:hypothetical protein